MAEMLNPTSKTKFMPSKTQSLEETNYKEERLFVELKEMRRQIQASCVEEIKCQSQWMVMEIKRSLQSAVKNMKRDQNDTVQLKPEEMLVDDLVAGSMTSGSFASSIPASDFALSSSVPPRGSLPPSFKDCNRGEVSRRSIVAARAKTVGVRRGQHDSKSSRTPKTPTTTDPRCPLTAYGDMPPLLPFEVEQYPAQPITEEEDEEEEKPKVSRLRFRESKHSLGSNNDEDDDEDKDAEWNFLAGVTPPRRRLSLTVDACRRTSKKKKAKGLLQMTAKDFLNSTKFDNLIGGLIIMNACTIGLQTDYAASHLTEEFPQSFLVIERVFLACFTMELLLRLYVQRCKFFCDRQNLFWNYFDTTVVVAQLVEETVSLIFINSTGTDADQFRVLRILRILRIMRILRVVRVLHLISELRTIVSSIMGSFKSLGWTVVLLLLMIYIVSVYFTQTISEYLITKRDDGQTFNEHDTTLLYYFGSLSRTILSLWQAMSGGADWDSMAGPLIEQVGVLTGLLFAAYIAFALLALMNVVTGVFVQTALQSAKDEEDAFLVDQVLKLFDMANSAKDKATISADQIEDRLGDPKVAAEWRSINVQPAEAQYLFSLLDIDDCGEISFQEFLSGCLRLHGPAKSRDVLTVMQEARSAMRAWRLAQKRQDENQFASQVTLEAIANSVSACSTLVGRLAMNIDSAVDVANQNQDKIGRLEKRIRSFEGSLCSVRIAVSNMSKMHDFIDTVIGASIAPDSFERSAKPAPAEDGAFANSPVGGLPRIDEV